MKKLFRVEKRTNTEIMGAFNYQNSFLDKVQKLEFTHNLNIKYLQDNPTKHYAVWRHPRVTLHQDPYIREFWMKLIEDGDAKRWLTGCESIEQLSVWFPKEIRSVIDNEGFFVTKYYFKHTIKGLRQSIGRNQEGTRFEVIGKLEDVLI
jgi:hypothetical protein